MELKVLQLGKFHPIKGGVEKVMYAFMEGLSARGIACDMLCASADDEVGTTELTPIANIIKTKTIMRLSATMISPDMIKWLKRICHNYDIIHIHHPDPMAALALKLSGYNGKVILHWHSDILKQKALLKLYWPLQRWLIDRADLVLGTTPIYVKQSQALKHDQHKTSYLPIGVARKQADPELVAKIRNKYAGKKIVYSVGRLVEYKGYEFLVEAASLLPDDYVVLIGGSGPLKGELQEMVSSFLLGRKVKILGYIPEEMDAAYYAVCDVFCLSSIIKTEAFAIVQIEAMSMGRPVVATNIPGSGVPWVNKHGVSGINITPRSSREMADAIRKICENPTLYKQYSDGARKRFDELFTEESMTDRLINIYNELMQESRQHASSH